MTVTLEQHGLLLAYAGTKPKRTSLARAPGSD